ncbi:hypothetical protein MHC_01980 [Mycoplasma haemocanis str. Illinois]|uniref:Uncharacterized protein n=1 Tax=Mycoplasma haemocanis (strain Illinois) TaxID=1111676 RepID=H6N6J0_MYCHN|nr:hypothetical protein [Mycoplasma haemocanis]AEW45262.1 hypothetical protein MHC_01980 [Mycoplasma haemocanis str. Illinois]
MALAPKFLIGGVVVGGVSIGFGIESLTSTKLSTKYQPKTESVPVKDCLLYELISVTKPDKEAFKPTTKDAIKKKVQEEGGDFDSIERACLQHSGQNTFVSKKKGKWGYHEDAKDREKFQKYLGTLTSRK